VDRGYCQVEVKSFDAARRVFAGIASSPTLDRQGHRVDPAGVTFRNPIPLLFHHDQKRPIGTAVLFPPTADGSIPFEATIPIVDEPGAVKDRTDEAIHSLTAGIIRGVSIGFRVLENGARMLKDGTLRLLAIEVVELSIVAIPANVDASVLMIKSLAASGSYPSGVSDRPAVRALKVAHSMLQQTNNEAIRTWENTRAAKVGRMAELMKTASENNVTLDDVQVKEYDGLRDDVRDIDGHLTRLKDAETLAVAQATPIAPGSRTIETARAPISVKSNVPKGTAFVRYAMAVLASNGNKMQAIEIAKQWKDSTPEVEIWAKAAVAAGNTTDPNWAGPLAVVQNATNEFLELLRPATIIGKITGLRMVPFNTSVPVQTAGGSYGWVGQAAPKPVSKLLFASATLGVSKAAGIIVFTEELARVSSPSAEAVIRADMIAGIAAFLDQQFTDPAVAAVANVSPGSITNGTVAIASVNALADVYALVAAFSAQNVPLSGAVLIMSEANAFGLSMYRNGGTPMFAGMTAAGGTFEGIQVITSAVVGTNVILAAPSMILMADEGQTNIDVSREASVQMDTAPMAVPDATVVMTSLWQNNLVGLRVERFINWQRGRTAAVKYVSGATYTPPPPTGLVAQSAPTTQSK
jgi:HK97 family phage major capsid protein/HK97 family phage prohead protease